MEAIVISQAQFLTNGRKTHFGVGIRVVDTNGSSNPPQFAIVDGDGTIPQPGDTVVVEQGSGGLKVAQVLNLTDSDRNLSAKEAARYLGCSVASIRRWSDKREITYLRWPGGERRFAQSELDRFIADRTIQRKPS